ncbi:Gustatory receptor, partial [Aphis craccivora]
MNKYNYFVFRFINGMIEFDRKLTPFSTRLLSKQRSFSKRQWDIIFISFFLFFIVFTISHFYLETFKVTVDIFIIPLILFSPPFILDYVITSSLCYFLHNLHARFWSLNDLWECLPAELVVDHDQWTQNRIVFFMEKTRLLHSELCELLKKFTIGFGLLLLAFFTFSSISLLICIFVFITRLHIIVNEFIAEELFALIFNVVFHTQIFIFMMSIMVYVSFIEEQVSIVIKHNQYPTPLISNLNIYVKKQIKMFLNQMSISGFDQITAFGLFNVNLDLVTS